MHSLSVTSNFPESYDHDTAFIPIIHDSTVDKVGQVFITLRVRRWLSLRNDTQLFHFRLTPEKCPTRVLRSELYSKASSPATRLCRKKCERSQKERNYSLSLGRVIREFLLVPFMPVPGPRKHEKELGEQK